MKWEGDRGAIKAPLGVNLNYPAGMPDALEYCTSSETNVMRKWESIAFEGGWFPNAFIGTMSSLMRFVEGTDKTLPTSIEDAFRTMALVEAAYRSSKKGGTPVPR